MAWPHNDIRDLLSASQVRADMRRWAERRGRPVPGWTRALGNDREPLRELADAVPHVLLVPSVFGAVHPMVDAGGAAAAVSDLPVGSPDSEPLLSAVATARALATVPDSLAAPLGRTRAMVLWTIAEHPGRTTTELARRTGISPASASQHATVPRTAGLTHTALNRDTAPHPATPLGLGVLDGAG
ncbi:MarR family transcriptional regulator [Streptomyces triticirhizae]|uniref:MarR family transcriptional regulator n=1 Tax=Streptomyces triticirhizae TaxID=2483353 RepID=A0A3M2LH08_9ACTN|nr:MarR family transcriptional regulator [Streptomyces triticirhizae]RMI36721.1 MarR family transcriptional regulator [Streptomyces triticirhizae]